MKRTRRFKIGSGRNLKVLLLALVALGAGAIGIALYATGVLDSAEGNTVDARFSVRGTQKPPKNLVVVAIDNKTYRDLNTFPFPRTYYAQLINNIAAEHPAAIVFDIDLENKSTIGKTCKVQGATYPCDDLALLEAIGNHPNVTVFGSTQPNNNGNGQVLFLGSTSGHHTSERTRRSTCDSGVPEQPAGGGVSPDDLLRVQRSDAVRGRRRDGASQEDLGQTVWRHALDRLPGRGAHDPVGVVLERVRPEEVRPAGWPDEAAASRLLPGQGRVRRRDAAVAGGLPFDLDRPADGRSRD